MTALWIVYAVGVSLALCVAAAAAERGLRLAELPARGVWAGALAGAAGLPFLTRFAGPVSIVSGLTGAGDAAAAGSGTAGGSVLTKLLGSTLGAVGGAGGVGAGTGPLAALRDVAPRLDGPILVLWLAASLVLAARLVVGWWRVRRRTVGRTERIHGRDVLVSADEGPALAGALRPEIVVPEWFLELPPEQRELALRHEEAHRRAGDPWLALGAEVVRMLLPWNPGIHWAAARLRRALELDCDRRLLDAGADRSLYGRLLVAVGDRSLGSDVTGAVALTERTSELRRRITMLRPKTESWKPLRMACAAAVALAAVALACETPVPPVEDGGAASGEIAVRSEASAGGGIPAVGDTLRPGSIAPLVVVDGEVAGEPLALDPLNIETVEVVKGKAATERYGSRARNGLINITTADGSQPSGAEPRVAIRSGEAPSGAGIEDSHLIVVDGEVMGPEFDPAQIDRTEIEAIEVVKGRAARALYGERAGEGVIRITTKGDG